jgi:hypothetical protein
MIKIGHYLLNIIINDRWGLLAARSQKGPLRSARGAEPGPGVEAPRLGHAAGPGLASEHAYAMILHIYTTVSFFGGFPVTLFSLYFSK